MSPSAQQSENFPAGWIGDRPEDNLILCPAICNHLVTVTRWLPIVNHAWSRSRCLSSATCGAKHLPRPAQYRSRFCDKECPSPLGGLHQLEVACLADRKIARPGSMGSNGSPFWVHPWFATGRRRRPVHGRSPRKLTEPPPDALGL